MANEFDFFDLHCLGRQTLDREWCPRKRPLGKTPRGCLQLLMGLSRNNHLERSPRRDVKTPRGPFLRLGLSATSLTIHSVLMYNVDAAVRPAVPELFGNKF